MARTHGLDKRLAEEHQKTMASTQKQSKHHSHNSSTQDSVNTGAAGSTGKPYKSGSNVSKGAKPAPGKGGVSVASKPKQSGY